MRGGWYVDLISRAAKVAAPWGEGRRLSHRFAGTRSSLAESLMSILGRMRSYQAIELYDIAHDRSTSRWPIQIGSPH